MTPIGKYGPAVIGEEKYEEEQAIIERQGGLDGQKFGPAITESLDQNPDFDTVHQADPRDFDGTPSVSVEAEDEEPSPEEQLPPGYSLEGGKGGYYILIGPDGERVEGPTGSGKWGPGVDKAIEGAAHHYEEALKQEETDEQAGADAQVSVDQLRGVLESDPGQVDAFVRAEMARAEGPRLEALRLLRDTEASKENPRQESIAALDQMIEDVQHGGEDEAEDEE